ncbi:alpha/beta hydrolase [Pelosinus sp. Bkl1]|uniref:Alpha/beta hydrolase n=1 Tax=Pelosinus baikalensis TaxID=2892015 RepID=A0ABS8HKW9_9FIRM|nr:alpha/beta hydrolase [Pelosinus baikalensis]
MLINRMRDGDIVSTVGTHVGSRVLYLPSEYPRGIAGVVLSGTAMWVTRRAGPAVKAADRIAAHTVGYKLAQHSISYFYEEGFIC